MAMTNLLYLTFIEGLISKKHWWKYDTFDY